MDEFDDLMSDLGVKSIKKDKKEKENGKEKAKGNRSNATIVPDVALLHRPGFKKMQKKEKKESFEEALKIYSSNARIKDDELIDDSKINTNIFMDRFSKIEEEDIMHTIDLHNYTLDEAEILVKKRIVWCYRERLDYVLIITGKGNHSSNGPVLKVGIKNLLMTMSNLIKEIEYAPRYLGGEGAYMVKIRL